MTDSGNFLYLSEQILETLGITTIDAIAAIEHLIRGCAEGTVWSAPKAVLKPPDSRYLMATLAAADDPPFMSVKSLVLNPDNAGKGIPSINASLTLLDSRTGLPAAVMDGNWITAVRTAALSGMAARRLALSKSEVCTFIGFGVQVNSHLRAFADLFPLTEIRAYGRGQTNIDALCETACGLGLKAVPCSTAQDAVTDADLIITSVSHSAAFGPFLDAGWLKPGAFAAVIDLGAPWIEDSLSRFDRIVIDDLEQEASLANKLVPPELMTGDLTQLVLGEIDGRGADTDRTAFIFRAHPLGDLALAALAYRKAVEKGLGTAIKT